MKKWIALFESETVFYHVTLLDNLRSIIRVGLIPRVGERSDKLNEEPRIFLFPSIETAEDAVASWLGEEFDEDDQLVLLEVNPAGIEVKQTEGIDWEWYCEEPILPQSIKIITTDF